MSRSWSPRGDSKLIYEFLPNDTSRQRECAFNALSVLDNISTDTNQITVVDVGCGLGNSYDQFSQCAPNIRWVGLDILDSQEVNARSRKNLHFCSYDGVHVPLADNTVDIAYSRQVFEHVRYPEALISDIYRVLKPGGFFVGSTSHLEPFHSRSYWNYTPYGFSILLQDAGFQSIAVRPGIDSLTLIGRRGLSYLKLGNLLEPFFRIESPLNVILEIILRLCALPANRRNALKLLFSGQFCFSAKK